MQLPPGATLDLLHRRAGRPAGAGRGHRPLRRRRGLRHAQRGGQGRRGRERRADRARRRARGARQDRRRHGHLRGADGGRGPGDLGHGSFRAEPIRVSEARKIAFDMFIQCGMDDDQADLACLLVSEVVTNVVLHTALAPTPRHEFAWTARRSGGSSASPTDWLESTRRWARTSSAPRARSSCCGSARARRRSGSRCTTTTCGCRASGWLAQNDEGGRGLYLVDQLADRWGSRPTEDGKAVWFQMPIRPPQPACYRRSR